MRGDAEMQHYPGGSVKIRGIKGIAAKCLLSYEEHHEIYYAPWLLSYTDAPYHIKVEAM